MNKASMMMWFVGNPPSLGSLRDQIEQGIAHYAEQYDRTADICLVNPADFDTLMNDESAHIESESGIRELYITYVRVRPSRVVVRLHAYIGVDEDEWAALTDAGAEEVPA